MANKARGRWSRKQKREVDRAYERYAKRRARKQGKAQSSTSSSMTPQHGHATRSTERPGSPR